MAWSQRFAMRWQAQSAGWTRSAAAMLTRDEGQPCYAHALHLHLERLPVRRRKLSPWEGGFLQ